MMKCIEDRMVVDGSHRRIKCGSINFHFRLPALRASGQSWLTALQPSNTLCSCANFRLPRPTLTYSHSHTSQSKLPFCAARFCNLLIYPFLISSSRGATRTRSARMVTCLRNEFGCCCCCCCSKGSETCLRNAGAFWTLQLFR